MSNKFINGVLEIVAIVALLIWLSAGVAGYSREVHIVATGPTVTLTWDANIETDLAGYTVHYGTQSGVYTQTVNVGKTTIWTLQNTTAGTSYYFVVTAINTSGVRSPFSNQVSETIAAEEPPPPPPTCPEADVPQVFVTRWELTGSRTTGSDMAVMYRAFASKPITIVQARLNGFEVKSVSAGVGGDLRESGAIWFKTPAPGTYTVTIWVRTADSLCTREAASVVKLVVK